MKFKELVQLGTEERERKLKELHLELIKLNSQVATGTPPKNAGQLKRLKKDIARIMLLKSGESKVLTQRKEKVVEQRKSSEPKEAPIQQKKHQLKKQKQKQNE